MKKLQPEDRAQLVEDIVKRNAAGFDPIRTSIRRLRLEVTGLDQKTFAAMCKMSAKSLYELESGKSNPKLSTLEGVLRLFGVRMGMVMTAKDKPTATLVGNTVGQLKAGGAIAVGAPLASSCVVAGPKRGKSPAAAKAKKAVSRPASPRARKSSQEQ
ncbi:helix-turn-helix domain-containing protein [Pseudomonas sp. KCJK9009]|uniref:helix-turn-helix domain-containing protein n=1 Tax=Pseudomonas sp. KCJK9009 TaxID=3344561 RepID=UPI003905A222